MIKKALENVKDNLRFLLDCFNTPRIIEIQRQVSDNSDKLDQLLSQERTSSHNSSINSSRNTKDYLVDQIEQLSRVVETSRSPTKLSSSPLRPEKLASNTHRPLLSDSGDGLRKAILKTRRILDTYSTGSANEAARSFNELSVALMDAGLAQQASKISSFSVRIYQNMPTPEPDSEFAIALRNHSNHLKASGRIHEAVDPARRAVEIYSYLPDRLFDPGRAGAFDNLAVCSFKLGQTQEALDASNQAVKISRDLLARKSHDDQLTADLAMFLSNRALILQAAKFHDGALQAASEAQKILLKLHRSSERYTPEYVDSLRIYSQMLSELGDTDQALQHTRQALTLLERLAKKHPDIYRPNLARCLVDLFEILSALNRRSEAEKEIRRAVTVFADLVEQSPGLYNAEYAYSLRSTARVLMDRQKAGGPGALLEDALSFLDKASSIYEALLGPTVLELVSLQQDRSSCHTRLKDYSSAVEASRSALKILTRLSSNKNERLLADTKRDLAIGLYHVSLMLDRSPPEAVTPALESVELFRALVVAAPKDKSIRENFVVGAIFLSRVYSDLGKHKEALQYSTLAVKESDGRGVKSDLTKKAWTRLSYCYSNMGDEKLAANAEREADKA
ncbi:hypothetical protein R3P38DRAFT_1467868 [Favolaschia claudopus]|uniref:TPR-like protein n=1 Tax=Favolaschia claudopus TaxID=2862362 RepID=A0AAW0DQB9_9AGAR